MWNILIFFVIVIFPIITSFPSNLNEEDVQSELIDRTSPVISLKNFTIYKVLGSGACGTVYLVKKNGGSDDGKLYAMKSQNIPNYLGFGKPHYLISERKILEEIRELPWSVTLHYAWRESNWLFLVMDVATGGTVLERLNDTKPDSLTAQRILAETVVALENIHNVGIIKGDFKYGDVLVDSDGHIVIGDFGFARYLANEKPYNINDWSNLAFALTQSIFPPLAKCTEIQRSLYFLLDKMKHAQISVLKKHSYFDGIDWELVAEKRSVAPFDQTDIHIDDEIPLDPATLFTYSRNIDNKYERALGEEFAGYFYVAPEHQN